LDGEPVPTLQNTQNKSAVTKSVSTEKTPTAPAKGADSLSSTQKPVPKPAQKAVTVTSTKTTPVISAQSESKAAAVPSVTPSVSSKPESKPDIKTDVKADVKVPAEQKVAVVEPTATATPRTSTTSSASGNLSWLWPAKGSLSGKFGGEGLSGKGINILGKRGDPVLAAASGTVVYAGSGLVGYGKLLIVRHDDTYISAYAYNEKFLVTEGDAVKAGQPIAEMGASGTDRDKLHFEIRERGKPVDPLRFLPNR
jgi:lipoprotein NlpD